MHTRAISTSATTSRSPIPSARPGGGRSCGGSSPSWPRRTPLVGASVEISGQLPPGAGLSSSAALEVALCLALADLGGGAALPRLDMARLCARVENDWVGAHTGLLDQLASLYGAPDTALCIDFRTLHVEPVPLMLDDWRLVVLDSGERHLHAASGYNQRRAECARACELLGVESLREADAAAAERLPEPMRRRALHVIEENERVREAVLALRADDLARLGELLMPRTAACATTTRSQPRPSRPPSGACSAPAPAARAWSAAASAAACSACSRPAPRIQPTRARCGPARERICSRHEPQRPLRVPLDGAAPYGSRQAGHDERARGHTARQRQRRQRAVERTQQSRDRQPFGAAVAQRARAADRQRAPAQLARRRAQPPLRNAHR